MCERLQKWPLEKALTTYGKARREGKGFLHESGYRMISLNGKAKLEHLDLAERALGKPLPKGAQVHHMNEDKADNHTPWNLVVCPDTEYHRLLHRRSAALDACGHADWLKCHLCHRYDAPERLYTGPRNSHRFHLACNREKARLARVNKNSAKYPVFGGAVLIEMRGLVH
jgi:hypothetical protein